MDQLLTRQDIDATKLTDKFVPVPEWGGKVRLLQMGGTERDDWEEHCGRRRNETQRQVFPFARATLVARCLVDAEGNRLYADEEVPLLSAKAGSTLDFLFDECVALNKLGKQAEDDAVKNSETAPCGGSTES
jgi:hypothetical protein